MSSNNNSNNRVISQLPLFSGAGGEKGLKTGQEKKQYVLEKTREK